MRTRAPDPRLRRRILAAARSEFARRGLRGASTRAIAGRAGATAAMINYYFRGKQGLYDAVVEEAMERLGARLQRALADGAGGLAARLALAYFDFLVAERDLQRIVMRETLDRGPAALRFSRRHLKPLRPLLEAAAPGGSPSRLLQTAISIFGAVSGYFLYEPLLRPLLGAPPLSRNALAERRLHVEGLCERLDPLSGNW